MAESLLPPSVFLSTPRPPQDTVSLDWNDMYALQMWLPDKFSKPLWTGLLPTPVLSGNSEATRVFQADTEKATKKSHNQTISSSISSFMHNARLKQRLSRGKTPSPSVWTGSILLPFAQRRNHPALGDDKVSSATSSCPWASRIDSAAA